MIPGIINEYKNKSESKEKLKIEANKTETEAITNDDMFAEGSHEDYDIYAEELNEPTITDDVTEPTQNDLILTEIDGVSIFEDETKDKPIKVKQVDLTLESSFSLGSEPSIRTLATTTSDRLNQIIQINSETILIHY